MACYRVTFTFTHICIAEPNLGTTGAEVFEDNKMGTSGIPNHRLRQSVLGALILVFEVFSEVI